MTILTTVSIEALRPELPGDLGCPPHSDYWTAYRMANGAELLYHAGWRRGGYLATDRDEPRWLDECSLAGLTYAADQDSPRRLP